MKKTENTKTEIEVLIDFFTKQMAAERRRNTAEMKNVNRHMHNALTQQKNYMRATQAKLDELIRIIGSEKVTINFENEKE